MKPKDNLILEDIIVSENLVKYKFSYTKGISDFFTTDEMFIEYDQNVSELPKSILAIPFVGSFVALTWLTDTVFWVKELDDTFYQTLKQLKTAYQELYPHYKFGGRFVSAKIETNDYNNSVDKNLLLFSGGVDAMTSYIRNKSKDLLLCNIQGWYNSVSATDPVAEKEFKDVSDFGAKNHNNVALVKSNFATIVNEQTFNIKVGRKVGDSWWHGFSHSMSFISISIPIAYKNRCSNILIASSFTIGDSRVCASYATTDSEFKFCTHGRTIHDGFELSRQDKIKVIVDSQRENKQPFPLKVCSFHEDNCCQCEKCFRTIAGIIAEGGNPRDFGFDINGNIKDHFVGFFANNLHFFGVRNESITHWPHIMRRMRANMDNILYRDFADWFLTYDFAKARNVALRKYYSHNFFKILKRKIVQRINQISAR